MPRRKRSWAVLALVCTVALPALAGGEDAALLGDLSGLTLRGGIGAYVLRDEFISRARYSGALPILMAEWTDVGGTHGSRFTLEFRNSSAIRNFNVSAGITELAFGTDWLYPVGRFSLFSHEVEAYLGPSSEIFVHLRSQNLATGGEAIFRTYSFASLFSLGANAAMLSSLGSGFVADVSLSTTLVSIGGRLVNPDESQASFLELLTFVSGVRCKADAGIRYRLAGGLSVRLGYRLEVARIDAWQYFISGSDCLLLALHYGF